MTLYYYNIIPLYNITILTSLKPLHEFAFNFVWMFLGWSPIKIVKTLILHGIVCNFVLFLANS